MNKSKWHNKLVNLAVAFALVFSLGIVAALPVASPVLAQVCGVELTANITSPSPGEDFCACTYFSLNVTIGNINATCNASSVQFIVWPGEKAEVVIGGVGQGAGTVKTFDVGFLPADASVNRTVQMHCVAAGETSIHVIPGGWDDCEGKQIPSACIHSDIVDITQKAPELDLELSVDDKVCYCDNFTATVTVSNIGTGGVSAVLPSLNVTPGTGATLLQGPSSANISAGGSATFNWTYHCDAAGSLNVTLTEVAAIDVCTSKQIADSLVSGVPQTEEVTQYKAHLVVGLEVPDATICVGQNFTAVVAINNTGNSDASGVNVTMNVTGPANCTPDSSPTWSNQTVDAMSEWSQNWTCNCTAGGNVTISVTNVTGMMCAESGGGEKAIPQDNIEMPPDPVTVVQYGAVNLTCDVDVGTVCQETSFTANATGGAGNYTWHWDFGDTHCSAGENTSELQNPTHTYMCAGNYTATVTVTDSACGNDTCSKPVNVTILAPQLISPPNGETVPSGEEVCFEWKDIGCCNYTLQVWQKEADGQKVWLVQTGHDNTWCGPLMDGNYRWWVTATDMCGNNATSGMQYFGVQESNIAVTVTSPNGGEEFASGETEAITWNAKYVDRYMAAFGGSQLDLSIAISYSSDSGANWNTIATGEQNDGSHPWAVPPINSDQCLIKVVATDDFGNLGVDTSDAVFTITTGVIVSVDAPLGVKSGNNFTANVDISEVTDFDAADFEVVFDSSVLEIVNLTSDVTNGQIDTTVIPVISAVEISAGRVRILVNVSGTPGVNGEGYLCQIKFHALGAAGTSSDIDLENGILSDNTGFAIGAVWTGTSVNVLASILGDANGDGNLNAVDITTIEMMVGGLLAGTPGADANQDGKWNALDITLIEILVAGP